MNRRAFVAIVRLALIRGRTGFLIGGSGALLGLLGAIFLPGIGRALAVMVSCASLGVSLSATFKSLVTDKMLGHLEVDRTLPLPLKWVAAGRLTAAAILSLPIGLGLAAIGVVIANVSSSLATGAIITAALLALLLSLSFIWTLTALIARFSMRWMAWLPAGFWMAGKVVPSSISDGLETRIEARLESLFLAPGPPVATLLGTLAGGVVLSTLVFFGATLFLADALRRYRWDPSAATKLLGGVPKRELGTLGRGPIPAIARMRLRLAGTHLRQQLIMVAVLMVIILVDLGEAADFARVYLPILTYLIPSALAIQIIQARTLGTLEGMQQLPHSRRVIGLGHLLAAMVLSLLAVVILGFSQVIDGIEVSPRAVLLRWIWFVAMGTLAMGLSVWLTTRRALALAAIVIVAPIGSVLLLGWIFSSLGITTGTQIAELLGPLGELSTFTKGAVPVGIAALATLAGNELFAWGLTTHTGRGVK